jgi:hypothetical protein
LYATPARGKYAGEVLLQGHRFNSEDIEQVWQRTEPPSRRLNITAWLEQIYCIGSVAGHRRSNP